MAAVIWTLVGLLAAALGILATALFAAIGRTDDLRLQMDQRFDRVDARFDRVDARFDRLERQIAALDRRLTSAGG